MDGLDREDAYDELFEPLALALGHLVLGAAFLEKAMFTDLIQRRVIRDGAEEVFGRGLVTELERLPAGALLLKLREFGYEEPLAGRITAVLQERNHFIHHLWEDPDFIRAVGQRKGVEKLVSRIEALVNRFYEVVRKLEPGVTSGMHEMFGCSPSDLLDLFRQMNPAEIEDNEIRRQLEALRELPDDMVSGGA